VTVSGLATSFLARHFTQYIEAIIEGVKCQRVKSQAGRLDT